MQPLAVGTETEATNLFDVERFRRRLRGQLVLPIDREYEGARRVWNGIVDKKPALIAYCAGPEDVAEAVMFARSHELLASVRSGGHNIAGNSVCYGGIAVELSRMKGSEGYPHRRL